MNKSRRIKSIGISFRNQSCIKLPAIYFFIAIWSYSAFYTYFILYISADKDYSFHLFEVKCLYRWLCQTVSSKLFFFQPLFYCFFIGPSHRLNNQTTVEYETINSEIPSSYLSDFITYFPAPSSFNHMRAINFQRSCPSCPNS